MARKAFSITAASTTIGRENFGSARSDLDPVMTTGYAAAKTAFEAALAVCVADAASPTQAHVTSADSAYTTFKAAMGGVPTSSDLVVSVDLAKISSLSSLRAAFNRLLAAAEAGGMAP